MSDISPPSANNPEDRYLDLQMAIEPRIQAIIDEVVAAGWNEAAALAALVEVLDNMGLAALENGKLYSVLATLMDLKR